MGKRTEEKRQEKETRKNKNNHRMIKLMLVTSVFLFVFGIAAVDDAYSEMMQKEGQVLLKCRRIDHERIELRMFGKAQEINIEELKEQTDEIRIKMENQIETLKYYMKKTFSPKGSTDGKNMTLL